MEKAYLDKLIDVIGKGASVLDLGCGTGMHMMGYLHLPSEDQPAMFSIFKDHLNDNGVLLFTSGKTYGEAWGVNGGENLFHASLDTHQYQSLLEAHGFRVLEHKEDDPECGEATVWMAQFLRKLN